MRIRRIAALAAVTVTLVSAPGAHAQPTTTTNQDSRPNSQPPPVDKGAFRPFTDPKEDVNYQKKTQCITSGTGDKRIPNKPWGQMQLRLEEAHRFATGKGVMLAIIDTGVNAEHP